MRQHPVCRGLSKWRPVESGATGPAQPRRQQVDDVRSHEVRALHFFSKHSFIHSFFFNFYSNVSRTLPFQNRSNIARIVLSPDNKILLTIDVDGYALFINFQKQVVIAHFNFRGPVTACTFSPDSRFFGIATGKKFKIFESPSVTTKCFSPLVLYKKYGNLHTADITGISWTSDSRFFITWSDDLTIKLMSLHKIRDFLPFTFSGYHKKIVSAFFNENDTRIFSVS